MTDHGAPPLNPTLQQLEAVLRGIEERTPHQMFCLAEQRQEQLRGEFILCRCDKAARVRAEQARAWAASLNAMSIAMYVELSPDKCDEAALAAALRAGEEHQ